MNAAYRIALAVIVLSALAPAARAAEPQAQPAKPAARKPLTEADKLRNTEKQLRALAAQKRAAAAQEKDEQAKRKLSAAADNAERMAGRAADQLANELVFEKDPAVVSARAKREALRAEWTAAQREAEALREEIANPDDRAGVLEKKERAKKFVEAMKRISELEGKVADASAEVRKAEESAEAAAPPPAAPPAPAN